jgi:hypothetical protein
MFTYIPEIIIICARLSNIRTHKTGLMIILITPFFFSPLRCKPACEEILGLNPSAQVSRQVFPSLFYFIIYMFLLRY